MTTEPIAESSVPDSPQLTKFKAEIAPKLIEISNQCKDAGLSFCAFIELPDSTAEVSHYNKDMAFAFQLGVLGFRCGGNIDELIKNVAAIARVHGHDSPLLDALGIPRKPTPTATTVPPKET